MFDTFTIEEKEVLLQCVGEDLLQFDSEKNCYTPHPHLDLIALINQTPDFTEGYVRKHTIRI